MSSHQEQVFTTTKKHWCDDNRNCVLPEILPLTIDESMSSHETGFVLDRSHGEPWRNQDGKNPFQWRVKRRNCENEEATVMVFMDQEHME